MAVEIYREPELELMIENDEIKSEWKNTIESLEMEGQKQLIENSESGSPSVYQFMNSSMVNMFNVLCPSKVNYTLYSKSTIPLEVLKEIALSVHENYFHKIEVWYDDIDPDPIAVGYVNSSYDSPRHLIARWGDEIIPMEELRIKARNRLLTSVKRQYKAMESTLESSIEKHLAGQYVNLGINLNESFNSIF